MREQRVGGAAMTRRFGRVRTASGAVFHVEHEGEELCVLERAPWLGGEATGERLARSMVARHLAPVEPRKIVCVGRNYAAHARELGNEVPEEPLLFFKPTTSLLDPGGTIVLPPRELSERVEHEVELGVVVGEVLFGADRAACAAAIFGYTIVGDITARDLQRRDKQWTRAKGIDTFCPVGPVVVAGLEASSLGVRARVDGELRQDGNTANMLFSPPELLSFISQAMTLEPGDLVVTGTPEGVGPLAPGNRLELEIDGIGVLALDVGVRH